MSKFTETHCPTCHRVIEDIRTIEQNNRMWAMCTDLSEQAEWYGHKLTKEEWKLFLTGCLKGQKMLPGVDGGVIMITDGESTRRKSKKFLSELMDYIEWFGATHNVVFKEPKGG